MSSTIQNDIDSFYRRQQEDLKRYNQRSTTPIRRRDLPKQDSKACNHDSSVPFQSAEPDGLERDGDRWRNSDGERLDDFGVDENAENYDEDDTPLAELLRRRHRTTDYNDSH